MGSEDEVTVNAFGKSLSIKGIGTILVVILILFAGVLTYLLHDLSDIATKEFKALMPTQTQTMLEHKALIDALASIRQDQSLIMESGKRLESSIKVQNWIMLTDQFEKTDIKHKINMPKELRDLGVRER